MITIADLTANVFALAQSGLNNPALATLEQCEYAAGEAIEIADRRVVSDTTMLDIAFFRLKIRLKIAIDEADTFLYHEALKLLKTAPIEGAENTGGGICYGAV